MARSHSSDPVQPNGLLIDGCDQSKPPRDPEKHVDCRFPARPFWLARSGLDFLDVHIYEADGSPKALAANLDTEEWKKIPEKVPIVMGEFGCNINWYPNATMCAPNVRQLQISSCAAVRHAMGPTKFVLSVSLRRRRNKLTESELFMYIPGLYVLALLDVRQ